MNRKLKDWHQYPARTNVLLLRLVLGRKKILEKGDLFPPKLSFLSIHTPSRSILWTIYSKHNSKMRNRRATSIIWKQQNVNEKFYLQPSQIPFQVWRGQKSRQLFWDFFPFPLCSIGITESKQLWCLIDLRLCCALNLLLPTSGNFIVLALPILTLSVFPEASLSVNSNAWMKFCSHFLRHMHLRDIYRTKEPAGARRCSTSSPSFPSWQLKICLGRGGSQHPMALQPMLIARVFPALDQTPSQLQVAHQLSLTRKELFSFTSAMHFSEGTKCHNAFLFSK